MDKLSELKNKISVQKSKVFVLEAAILKERAEKSSGLDKEILLARGELKLLQANQVLIDE